MEEFDDDDDFGDLYADVEVQVSSAICAIRALSHLPMEDDKVYGNGENGGFQDAEKGVGGINAEAGEEKREEGAEGEEDRKESEDESETEDDFDIVLNDDGDNDTGNGNGKGNVRGRKDGLLSGGSGGRVGNDDEEYRNKEETAGNFGVENGGSSEGKGGCSRGSYNSQYKYMRYSSTMLSSKLKSNGSAGIASYFSTFVRGDWENDGYTYQFGKSSIGSQIGHNFSLPRSRTILDVNIDALEQKPWRNSGADITDFFNFGFDEDSWKSYCNHLHSHREQTTKVTDSAAYWHARRSKDCRAEFDHEVVQEAATKNFVHCNQTGVMSLANDISCTQPQSEMLKGRTIQVEDGLGERQPSVDRRLSIDRDSDVVIEIPVQDLEEDHSNSDEVSFDETTKNLHEASQSREAGVDDAADTLHFSACEDELFMLEGTSEGTRKSNPHKSVLRSKCFRHTSTGDGDPLCLDSDSHESLCVSDANERQHQVTKYDSDGLAEEIKASDEPEKSDGTGKPAMTSEKSPESSRSEESQGSRSSSPSQSDYVGSRVGAYADPDEFHDHSKRASLNSASELRESITFDYHSSKDSRKPCVSMRSGDYKYVARCRSPVRRIMKFQKRRSSRMSGLRNHLDDECASRMSDAEVLYGANYPAVGCHRQRKRHHDFDSYGDYDYLYHENFEHALSYRRARFPSKAGYAFAGYPHGKDNQDCGYKGHRYPGRNMKGKQHFPEQRTPRLSNEVVERKWNHYRKGIYVQEMDSSNYDGLRELITEQAPYLDNRNHTRSKRKADEFHFERRMGSDYFSAEYNYSNEFAQEKYEPIPYDRRERAYLDDRHDNELLYTRREAKIPLKNTRRYGNPIHDCEGIWRTDCEDERSRYARNRISFRSYREPQTARRGWEKTASFSRNGMFGRHGRQRRQNCVERYRGSNKLDDYTDGYINDDESIQGIYDHDGFVVGRRQYEQSEVLHWLEQENDRHLEDSIKAGGTSYPYGRTSSYKRFDSKPGPGRGGKLIDGREPDKKRYYKLPIEGDSCSQFHRSSNSVHRDNLRQAPPSCWDSADSHIVVGDGKSSRCFKAGSLMYSGRYDFMDRHDDLEQRTVNRFNGSNFEKVIQADSPKSDGFYNDANWCKKLSDFPQNDSLDIEEGQIVAEDLNKKPRQKASALKDAKIFIGVKNFSSESTRHQNIDAEELENPRIMEILAKMEKRRVRFQQPITLKNAPKERSKPVAESNAEAKVQRPARKRKWDGS